MDSDRRNFLKTGGTLLSLGLAGCTTNKKDTAATKEQTHRKTASTNKNNTSTPKDLLKQTHSAENLDRVVQQLEQDTVKLNFVPKDENAEYAQSNVFNQYSNHSDALTVELNLNQAIQQRHHKMPRWGKDGEKVQEFIENIDNKEWRTQILREDGVDNPGKNWVDWETYTDEELNYGKRMTRSKIADFWYSFADQRLGGVSSTNNQFKAHALQGIEQKAGFDTFIWNFKVPSHGLVPATENPTRNEDETNEQETYIVETDFTDSQQVTRMKNSQYRNSEPFNGSRERKDGESLYKFTAIEGTELELYNSIDTSQEIQTDLIENFQNPKKKGPLYDHIDPMNAAAYIAEENIVNGELDGWVELKTDSITYNRPM